jgi:hypothetical protein
MSANRAWQQVAPSCKGESSRWPSALGRAPSTGPLRRGLPVPLLRRNSRSQAGPARRRPGKTGAGPCLVGGCSPTLLGCAGAPKRTRRKRNCARFPRRCRRQRANGAGQLAVAGPVIRTGREPARRPRRTAGTVCLRIPLSFRYRGMPGRPEQGTRKIERQKKPAVRACRRPGTHLLRLGAAQPDRSWCPVAPPRFVTVRLWRLSFGGPARGLGLPGLVPGPGPWLRN